MQENRTPYPNGFTLVEMMMGSTISAILILGAVTTFTFQRKAAKMQQQVNDMQQNARAAIDIVSRDVRMAGYGIHVSEYMLPRWIDWIPGLNANPMVVDGGSGNPDQVTTIAAFDVPLTTVSMLATNGSTVIRVAAGDGSLFNTTDKKVLYLGQAETVRIVAISGDNLTISTHPTLAGRGLKFDHAAGDPVELVKAVTFTCAFDPDRYPFQPHLKREDGSVTYVEEWQKIVAGHIDNFQITQNEYALNISVTARTGDPDPDYTHPIRGDHHRRLALVRDVFPRNARLKL